MPLDLSIVSGVSLRPVYPLSQGSLGVSAVGSTQLQTAQGFEYSRIGDGHYWLAFI